MTDLGDALKRVAREGKLDPRRLLECAVDAADVAEVKAADAPRQSRVWADISAAWSMAAKTALEYDQTHTVAVTRGALYQRQPDDSSVLVEEGHLSHVHTERVIFGRLMWCLLKQLGDFHGGDRAIISPELWAQSENAGTSIRLDDDGCRIVARVDG